MQSLRPGGLASTQLGASLLLALGFIAGLGLIIVALLGYAQANVRSENAFRTQRNVRYAADQAIDDAIQWAKDQPKVGTEPASSQPCYIKVPAVGKTPAMTVTCAAVPGSHSGEPKDTGQVPKYAILTLGQADHEAPSYNGSNCLFFGVSDPGTGSQGWDSNSFYGSRRVERGIRFSASTPAGLFSCPTTRAAHPWTVSGKIFANSSIYDESGGKINLIGTGSTLRARGGCNAGITTPGSVSTCVDAGRTDADPMTATGVFEGHDPATDNCGSDTTLQPYKDCQSWAMPVLQYRDTNGNLQALKQVAPPSPNLCAGNNVITLEPGWYTDIAALNALFGDSRCKGKTFWFTPDRGTDGKLLGKDYQQGLYYFDFTSGSGGGCNYYSSSSSTNHQWCIGKTGDANQHVIGGTPYGWDPFGPGTTNPTPALTNSTVNCGFFCFWNSPQSAGFIDGVAANYNNHFIAISRSVTLSDFSPRVSSGVYGKKTDNAVMIQVSHKESAAFGTPQISVTSGNLNCGTFTLHSGDYMKPRPVDSLSTAQAQALGDCLRGATNGNTGSDSISAERINAIRVQYSIRGCTFFCSSDPLLDGISIQPPSSTSQGTFPQTPGSRDPNDPGGDCDPTKPGVQFIFGGDSHVYVADGSMELCAGLDRDDPAGRQEIALRGVPNKFANYRPTSISSNSSTLSNPNNALRIAEPTGAERDGSYTTINYSDGHGNCGFCAVTYKGGVNLSFPKIVPPAGTTIDTIRARAAYNSKGLVTSPQLELSPCGSTVDFSPSYQVTFFNTGMVQQSTDASCLASSLMNNNSTSITWWARSLKICGFWICGPGSASDLLDGVELQVSFKALNPGTSNPSVVPSSGCIIAGPNYWNTTQGGEADCALLKADQNKTDNNSANWSQGRVSIKGTIYAPSSAIDVDDEDVLYPFFGRGLVARTLMLRGFAYKYCTASGTPTTPSNQCPPTAITPVVDHSVAPRVMTFTACTRGAADANSTLPCGQGPAGKDRIYARALVRFEQDTSHPPTYQPVGAPYAWGEIWARIPKVQWWVADR